MKFGISASFPWFGPPIVDLARHIEACGFKSMWTGEHIIVPVEIADPQRFGVPLPDNYKHMPELFVSLTAAAVGETTKLVFGTDVCLITQRDPLILAKTVATLDQRSGRPVGLRHRPRLDRGRIRDHGRAIQAACEESDRDGPRARNFCGPRKNRASRASSSSSRRFIPIRSRCRVLILRS